MDRMEYMTVKQELIGFLEQNKGTAVSGEALAAGLGVSRAAVWKAVKILQKEGYPIEAVRNRGYTLHADSDRISAEGIRIYLPEQWKNVPVEVLSVVDSTNTYAKKQIAAGAFGASAGNPADSAFHANTDVLAGANGNAAQHAELAAPRHAIIAANEQTAGRGRLGRSFFSPADTGIYMSLVLAAGCRTEDFLPITVAAAVAVSRVIERFTDDKPKIKWVNDVWLGNKKVCGILTEGISNFENGTLEAAVVGIGINVDTEKNAFPEAVQNTAVSLGTVHATRNELIAAVSAELFDLAEDLKNPVLMQEYRDRSLILGKEIYWEKDGMRHEGRAADINDAGNLVVDTEEGPETLISGEVSIRPLE